MNWYQKAAKKIKKEILESDAIDHASYDVDTERLTIRFRRGDVYTYGGISKKTFNAFIKSKSKGRFFNQIIRDRYPIIP